MSDSTSEKKLKTQGDGIDTDDVIDVIIDGSGDTTIRPIRPELLAQAVELRAQLQRRHHQRAAENAEEIGGDDVIDIIFDGPGDTTVRPIRPELLAHAMELKANIERWQAKQAAEAAAKQNEQGQ